MSDHIGRHRAFALLFGIQTCVFALFGELHSLPAVIVAYAIVLLCFGGGFGTMPSFNADYVGTRHMGANYGAMLTAWGVAGVIGPLLAADIKDAIGSFSGALPIVAVMLLVAMVLLMVIRKPQAGVRRSAPRIVLHALPNPPKQRSVATRLASGL